MLANDGHDKVKVLLGALISHGVCENLRLEVHTGALPSKDTLYSLKHLKDVHRIHATVIVMIAQLKHH